MRVYYPVNEFNELGYAALPLAIFLCEKLVLWSPMGPFIDKVYNEGASILNSKNIIQLVESGNIQIAGREQWFDKKYRNNLPFDKATYTEFDTEIRQLQFNSTAREVNEKYVIIAAKETGSQWAKQVLNKCDKGSKRIVATAIDALNNPTTIPAGVYEKIMRVPEEERLLLFLQIMRNNIKTMDQIQCDNLIYWKDYLDNSLAISGYHFPKKAAYTYPDIQKFVDMCDYLKSIVEIKDYKSFDKMLENRDVQEIKAEISRVLDSQLSVGEEYLVWYQDVLETLKRRRGKDIELLFDGCFTTAGIISILCGLYMNPTNSLQLDISLHAALPLINDLGTIVGAGKTIHDLKERFVNSNISAPTMPFIGGHIADRHKISKYKDLISETKKMIY